MERLKAKLGHASKTADALREELSYVSHELYEALRGYQSKDDGDPSAISRPK